MASQVSFPPDSFHLANLQRDCDLFSADCVSQYNYSRYFLNADLLFFFISQSHENDMS